MVITTSLTGGFQTSGVMKGKELLVQKNNENPCFK